MARTATARSRHGARRRRSAKRAGIRWDRLGRMVLLAVLVIVTFNYVGPAAKYWHQRGVAAEQRSELRSLTHRNRALRQRARSLTNPRSLELEARRLGMVRPGERPYVIEGRR